MAQPVLMPKFGQTVEEATIVRWRTREGERVGKGDVLFEIETDKAVLEVESFFEGTLLKVIVGDGCTVPVSSVVAFVGEPGEALPDAPGPAAAPRSVSVPKLERAEVSQRAVSGPAGPPQATTTPVPSSAAEPARQKISPRARRLLARSVVSGSNIEGTGSGGRVVERDVLAYLEEQGYGKLRVSPAAKALAAKEGLDLLRVRGSGEGGRILMVDVRNAVLEKPRKMSKMRQVIARRLTESFAGTPHFYVTVSVDMTDLLAYRQELKNMGRSYKVTDFILESVILALKEFAPLNSVAAGDGVCWRSKVQLGLAVSVEDGLVVPVIRDAEDLALSELSETAAALAARARAGKLLPDEMTGSTFTVSNMGMLDIDEFSAIINPGESGILAVASTVPTPVVREGKVVVRSIMKITLSVDHRVVDGATGAAFANAVKKKLEDVELWKRLT